MRYWILAIMVFVLLAAVLGAVNAQYVNIPAIKRQAAREGWTFQVAENPATQRPLSELTGLVEPKNWQATARFDNSPIRRGLPSRFDWREQVAGGMPPIRNQGGCGSCWAFSTTGALECAIKIKDGINVDLSEQYLVSCNTDNWSCAGGWYAHAYHMDKEGKDRSGPGAVPEYDFPYVGTDVECGGPHLHTYLIRDYAFLAGWSVPSVDSIKQAIVDHGPVSIAIAVDGNFQAYAGGVFNANTASSINHAVVLVGWDNNNGKGYWILRNSWGPGWGEGGYMRIRWGCDRVGYATTWVDYPGKSPLGISLPNGVPESIAPGSATTIAVDFDEVSDAYAPGTGVLKYRYNGGTYKSVPLVHVADNHYTGTLPPAACGDEPEYFVEAYGISGGAARYPEDAPSHTCSSVVGQLTTVLYDNLESDLGWVVQNSTSLIRGQWERGIPLGSGDLGDPPSDYDGTGKCYVTGLADGDNDVDGANAYTFLISPTVNLYGAADAKIHYALWYTNYTGAAPNADYFKVSVSSDNGNTWTLIETVGPATTSGWTVHELVLPSAIALTATMKVRFEASDMAADSTVEAGIDDVRISTLTCGSSASQAPSGWFSPGWTWFSIPVTPSRSNAPSTLLGFDCTNRLYRWDGLNKTVQYCPDDFNNLTVGTGYMVFLNVGESYRPTYSGVAPASPLEWLISRAGCWWIGVPGAQSYAATGISVRKDGVVRSQSEDAAAADPWINWNWVYWDPNAQTARIMDPSGGGDDTYVRPWYGYRVWLNTDYVTIIYP